MEYNVTVEHRLPGVDSKGFAGFSNSECYVYEEVGSRGVRVSPTSLTGTTVRMVKDPKC